MPSVEGSKQLSVHFLKRPGVSRLPTENIWVHTVRVGHQIGYSRAYTISKNINKRSKEGNIEKCTENEQNT